MSKFFILFILLTSQLLFADVKSTRGIINFDSNNDNNIEMTLTSNGLGLGVNPSANLHVNGNTLVSNIHISGALSVGIQNVSSNTTLSDNSLIFANTSNNDLTITLPYAGNVLGRQYSIKKTTNHNSLTIMGDGDLIDNQSSLTLNASYSGFPYINLVSDGSQWYVERRSTEYRMTGSDNLVGWWKFDELDSTIAVDSSGQNNNGSTTNLASEDIGVSGKKMNAISFSTSNDYVQIPSDVDLEAPKFTWSLWAKFNALGSQQGLMVYSTDLLVGNGAILLRKETGDQIAVFIHDGTDYESRAMSAAIGSADTWYHIAVTFDEVDLKVYVDGIASTQARPITVPYATTNNLIIGNVGGFGNSADAKFDDIRVYNRALDANEIEAIYQQNQ